MLFNTRIGAALLISFGMLSGPVMAGPVSLMTGYWSIQFADTDVRCGTVCSTDIEQLAIFEEYDLLGFGGLSHARQSGSSYAAMSALGFGAESESDSVYEYQLAVARAVFASVGADAPPAAFAEARVGLGGYLGFQLTEAARYSGTTINAFRTPGGNGMLLQDGMILEAGVYESFFGSAWGSALDTGRLRAGQQVFAADLDIFTVRLESLAVPEPGTLALLGAGLLGLGWANRRTRIRKSGSRQPG
jgi:hypothetical protein